MDRRLRIEPEAEEDITEAYVWYEQQRTGLGEEFLLCLEEAYARALTRPQSFAVKFDEFRRVLVRRFPFAVWFEDDAAEVTVYAVYHCARNPAALIRRLTGG